MVPVVVGWVGGWGGGWFSKERRSVAPHELVMQSTCGAYELLFWVAEPETSSSSKAPLMRPEPSASKLRDACWATWTATLGWPVQGIWAKVSERERTNQGGTRHEVRGGEGAGLTDSLAWLSVRLCVCAGLGRHGHQLGGPQPHLPQGWEGGPHHHHHGHTRCCCAAAGPCMARPALA